MASGSDHEASAVPFAFQPGELKWQPSGPAVRVAIARSAKGTVCVIIGSREASLTDVRSFQSPAPNFVTLHVAEVGHVGLQFEEEAAAQLFSSELSQRKADYERFEQYDPGSVQSYFQYYGKLGNQQNMLQDHVRTGCYRRAILENPDDFRGKAVMDLGAGSGILSFFAAQAGAGVVYAVEASSMAEVIRTIADSNVHSLGSTRFEVVNRPVEAIADEVSGKVDVLVSEPIGTFLFNERMIESYLYARDRFLKPGGKMFPNAGNLFIAPFSDATLHWEQQNKNAFWKNTNFHGIDLTAAAVRSSKEHFRQPVVDYISPECLVAEAHGTRFDFMTCTVESLKKIDLPFDFEVQQTCLVHGIAGWFDASFDGTNAQVLLSTSPTNPGTHWYQIRFLLEKPLAVNAGQHIEGTVSMEANNLQSYYVRVFMRLQGTSITSEAPQLDLKDPEYRFYTSPNSYCPPGTASFYGGQQQTQGGDQQPMQAAAQLAQQAAPAQQAGSAQTAVGAAASCYGAQGQQAWQEQGQQDAAAQWPSQYGAVQYGQAQAPYPQAARPGVQPATGVWHGGQGARGSPDRSKKYRKKGSSPPQAPLNS